MLIFILTFIPKQHLVVISQVIPYVIHIYYECKIIYTGVTPLSRTSLREIVLDLTDKCPARCIYCSAEASSYNSRFLSVAKVFEILNDASRLGVEIVSFSGGEPLLHPDLISIIMHAKKLGIKDVRLFTSGLIFNKDGITSPDESFFKKLNIAGLDKIFFNLQGATENIHDSITQVNGAFPHVIRSIEMSVRNGLYVGVQFVPMKLNWRTFPELAHLCANLGVDEVGVLRFVPHGRGSVNREILELDVNEYREFLRLLNDLCGRYNRPRIRTGCPWNEIRSINPEWPIKYCSAGLSMCHILVDGSVSPCSASKSVKELHAGKIFNERLADIWKKGFKKFEEMKKRYGSSTECTMQMYYTIENVKFYCEKQAVI